MDCWCCSITTSYYARRGGLSSLGDFCGISFVALYDKADAARWVFGAALSFIASYYLLRGGHSSAGTDCGVFYVLGNLAVNVAYWHLGAALSFDFILYSSWWMFKQ